MVDLNGHEAGNAGHMPRKAYRVTGSPLLGDRGAGRHLQPRRGDPAQPRPEEAVKNFGNLLQTTETRRRRF